MAYPGNYVPGCGARWDLYPNEVVDEGVWSLTVYVGAYGRWAAWGCWSSREGPQRVTANGIP